MNRWVNFQCEWFLMKMSVVIYWSLGLVWSSWTSYSPIMAYHLDRAETGSKWVGSYLYSLEVTSGVWWKEKVWFEFTTMRTFSDWIQQNNLVDLQMSGASFALVIARRSLLCRRLIDFLLQGIGLMCSWHQRARPPSEIGSQLYPSWCFLELLGLPSIFIWTNVVGGKRFWCIN